MFCLIGHKLALQKIYHGLMLGSGGSACFKYEYALPDCLLEKWKVLRLVALNKLNRQMILLSMHYYDYVVCDVRSSCNDVTVSCWFRPSLVLSLCRCYAKIISGCGQVRWIFHKYKCEVCLFWEKGIGIEGCMLLKKKERKKEIVVV